MKSHNSIFIIFLLLLGAFLIYISQTPAPASVQNPTQTSESTPSLIIPKAPNKNPTHPMIVLEQPQESEEVSSPLIIEGEARGSWFFEATFPVVLTNWDGLIIAEGFATAEGDWMTQEFVPFTGELAFISDTSVSNRGSLILQKANPSGLPEHDDAYEITVFFK